MSVCIECGNEIPAEAEECPVCGTPVPQEAPVAEPAPELTSRASTRIRQRETLTTGGYLGTTILLGLPGIGLLLAIIWACCGCRNIARRRMARAALLYWLILIVVGVLLTFLGLSLFTAYMGDELVPFLEQTGLIEYLAGLGF